MSLLVLTVPQILQSVGYAGIFGIVFAESGLLFGVIFPGDSLLFAAGMLAAQHFFDIYLLAALCTLAAILGDSTGYWLGAKFGPKIFSREDSRFFRKEYVTRAEAFYEKHGVRTIVLARFVPVVRTIAPVLAGIGSMRYRTFLAYNIIGAFAWGAGITLLGYTLGTAIPNIEHYLTPIALAIMFVSSVPIIWEYRKNRKI